MGILGNQLCLLKKYFIFRAKKDSYELGDSKKETEDEGNAFDFPSEVNKDEYKDHLIAVQSFLHVSTEPHHWLIPAFDYLKEKQEKPEKINVKCFIEKLEEIDNNLLKKGEGRRINGLPSMDRMAYNDRPNHYWFYRLDYELWKLSRDEPEGDVWKKFKDEAKKEKAVLNLLGEFRFRKCGSIEHIKPQNPQESTADELVNEFGNLALISSSRNSKFSNNPTAGKKQIIIDSKYTESLKMLHFLYSDQNIQEQTKFMYEILEKAVNGTSPQDAEQCTNKLVSEPTNDSSEKLNS